MNSSDELCKKLTQDVANTIVQGRSWNNAEQLRFDYAVRYLLIDLWKKTSHLSRQPFINAEK